MKDGFVKVAARTPEVRVADVAFNVRQCVQQVRDACADGAKVVVLPELCITGYTCEDLFWQDALLDAAQRGLYDFADRTSSLDALIFVGVPWRVRGKLYNCSVALCGGEVLALIPKTHIPNYHEFYEARHFASGPRACEFVDLGQEGPVLFGTDVLLRCARRRATADVYQPQAAAHARVPEPLPRGLVQQKDRSFVALRGSCNKVPGLLLHCGARATKYPVFCCIACDVIAYMQQMSRSHRAATNGCGPFCTVDS